VESVELSLLGPLRVSRSGRAQPLPASRKARALCAYLALAPRAVTRTQLCEMLWDGPEDPRAELRWCLSKLRAVLDARNRPIVVTEGETVRLDVAHISVDALDVARAAESGIEKLGVQRQRELAALFEGEFLEGLEMPDTPVFQGWLTAQRRRFRACHAALLEGLATRLPDEDALAYLEKWRELAPFDVHVHERLLAALARDGRIREAEEHLAATLRLFEGEALDIAPIREAWRAARSHARVAVEPGAAEAPPANAQRRASVAVMPFSTQSAASSAHGRIGAALGHDVITRLAKLRSLFVIAQGTMRSLHERGVGAEDAGRILDVSYVVGGTVRVDRGRLTVNVELAETRSARIVWADEYRHALDDAFVVLDEIGNRIVAAIAAEIETAERNRAILKPPNSLDAWEACHRGLWHMYRYRPDDNEQAMHFFETALHLDPSFSRAHAGLSFTHFQRAFVQRGDRGHAIEQAYRIAAQGIMADEKDPAVHWAMGRALTLQNRWDESLASFERSIDLSPNFALGHYNMSFVRSIRGDPKSAIAENDLSRQLSPYDPMLFAMLGCRAFSLIRLGRFDEAVEWALRAEARPNVQAFPHMHAIAAFALALAGRLDEARPHAAEARQIAPGYGIEHFLLTFPFEPGGEALFRRAAKEVGLD
jgi:DNA-binding SARP family transcriptional activator